MSNLLVTSGAEVVQMVMDAERVGVVFYQSLAEAIRSTQAKNVFEGIQEEEQQHLAELEGLAEEVRAYRPPEAYSEKLCAYMDALMKSRVFTDEQTCRRIAMNAWDEAAAVQLASEFEKEIILLLCELRRFVPTEEQGQVDRLIEAEHNHLVQVQKVA